MGRFSLEFGRKGPEGLKAEHDEELIDDQIQGDGSEIKKLMDNIDTSMDEEDYSDCGKKAEPEKEDDFADCLKQSVKEDEEIDEYYDDCSKKAEEKIKEIIEEVKDPKKKFLGDLRRLMNDEER